MTAGTEVDFISGSVFVCCFEFSFDLLGFLFPKRGKHSLFSTYLEWTAGRCGFVVGVSLFLDGDLREVESEEGADGEVNDVR